VCVRSLGYASLSLVPTPHHPHIFSLHDALPILGIQGAAAYLDRHLHRIANDDAQDFPLLRRELRKCRQHLEAVLHNDTRPDRGRSEEHTSELQSRQNLVCRLLLEKKKSTAPPSP